jgi:hypothetical protein
MCNVTVLFGLTNREISPELGALYVGLSRTVWGVGLAWIVVACVTKHAGNLKLFLVMHKLVKLAILKIDFCINQVAIIQSASN